MKTLCRVEELEFSCTEPWPRAHFWDELECWMYASFFFLLNISAWPHYCLTSVTIAYVGVSGQVFPNVWLYIVILVPLNFSFSHSLSFSVCVLNNQHHEDPSKIYQNKLIINLWNSLTLTVKHGGVAGRCVDAFLTGRTGKLKPNKQIQVSLKRKTNASWPKNLRLWQSFSFEQYNESKFTIKTIPEGLTKWKSSSGLFPVKNL